MAKQFGIQKTRVSKYFSQHKMHGCEYDQPVLHLDIVIFKVQCKGIANITVPENIGVRSLYILNFYIYILDFPKYVFPLYNRP